ncbi:MAG: RNA 2',3'-cyclic phosphodiesterase [Eubacteriales bacterium]|jgi:2'-5' RNA ligase|nr:RNA 2',3'-cyclic phosphodiesterase [Eubacteriales bacterium]
MRLFVAINFSESFKAHLIKLQSRLKENASAGNFSLPENLHLTIVFLGECSAQQAAFAKSALDGLCFEPFDITVDHVGRFRQKGGDIWWAGVQDAPALSKVRDELAANLTAKGFLIEKRKFAPHITLGRRVMTGVAPYSITPFCETVKAVELMKSERIFGKLTYTGIFTKKHNF